MSAGAFTFAGYETDARDLVNVRVQPETLNLSLGGATNNSVPGTRLNVGSANVGGSRRKNGINTRLVRIRFTGTPPDGYKADSTIALPWTDPDTYQPISRGATGTYLGVACVCVGKTNEAIN